MLLAGVTLVALALLGSLAALALRADEQLGHPVAAAAALAGVLLLGLLLLAD
ncbi:MAG: hypothetical protein ACM33B_14150 [Pseudomonadota bacterium]